MMTTSPAETFRSMPPSPPKRAVAVPRYTPSASCAVLWKGWKGWIPFRHAAGHPLAVNRASNTVAGSSSGRVVARR